MRVRTQHQIEIAVSIEVARIEGHPSAGDALADGRGAEAPVSEVLEIHETLPGVLGVIGKVRDRGDV